MIFRHENNLEGKVSISVMTKFHAFRLAEGANRHGLLCRLYTSLPKFMLRAYSIPGGKIRSLPVVAALIVFQRKFKVRISSLFISDLFDRMVARDLARHRPSERFIFHGWNGFCERSLIAAKARGGIGVVERSCPHEDFEAELIREEKEHLLKRPVARHEEPIHRKMKREYDIADYIIVPSQYSLRSFIERGFSPAKVLVVPIANEKSTVPGSSPKGKFTVLCVGGDFYRKGMYYLLKAWEALALPDAELIIKGYLPEEFDYLRHIRNFTLIDRHLSDAEVALLYQRASIFVLPSIDDGFGMVVPEAMAAGLPVIITENVGIADGIENGTEGYVVPIRDSKSLADKMRLFYEHPEQITRMGQAALVKSKEYTPEAYGERIAKVYRDMLSAQTGGSVASRTSTNA